MQIKSAHQLSVLVGKRSGKTRRSAFFNDDDWLRGDGSKNSVLHKSRDAEKRANEIILSMEEEYLRLNKYQRARAKPHSWQLAIDFDYFFGRAGISRIGTLVRSDFQNLIN